MKHYTSLAWMMAIAIASTMTAACNSDNDDTRQPSITTPVEHTKFFVCEASNETKGTTATVDTVFSEDDIEWFDVSTRELHFRDMDEPLYEKLRLLSGVEFHLGDQTLFSGSTFVGLLCSQFFDDLVLCCGKIDGEVIDDGHYYLYDCYPPQFIDDDRVQANRAKRAEQWEMFIKYLESKGKLKK